MDAIQLQLDVAEVNKLLNALGALPYAEVYQLIEKIQQQAAQQIEHAQPPTPGVSASQPDAVEKAEASSLQENDHEL